MQNRELSKVAEQINDQIKTSIIPVLIIDVKSLYFAKK